MPGAWKNGEIRLDYQPLVSLDDGTVVGIQALLRWNHPHTGPLSHHECTELAARIGLMAPLGVQLVHCYGGTVIVRGIDTHSEADWWRPAGADIGRVLAPPASPDEIAALLGSR